MEARHFDKPGVDSEPKPEVANLGWVRPPLVYFDSIELKRIKGARVELNA